MYLSTADSLEEITIYGIDPLIEFMRIFEKEIQENLTPGSRESILWTEIMGKTLMVRERAEKINRARVDKKNSRMHKMERMLERLAAHLESEPERPDLNIIATKIKKVLAR